MNAVRQSTRYRRRRPLGLVAFAVISTLTAPRTAEACSPDPCPAGGLFPAGSVPTNALRFLWRPTWNEWTSEVRTPTVALTIIGPHGDPIPFSATTAAQSPRTYLIEPDRSELEPGDRLEFISSSLCPDPYRPSEERFSVEVDSERALPSRLGTLGAQPSFAAPLSVGAPVTCSEEVLAAQVWVELDFDPEAEPWASVLVFQTWVDGRPWGPGLPIPNRIPLGQSGRGRGRDLVYAGCEPTSWNQRVGLEPGWHAVELRASVLGHPEIRSTVVEVELRCPAGPVDGGEPEAGADERDAGPDSRDAAVEPTESGQDGCDCAAVHWAQHAPSSALLPLLLFVLVGRRLGRREACGLPRPR